LSFKTSASFSFTKVSELETDNPTKFRFAQTYYSKAQSMYLKTRLGDGYIHDFNFVATDPSTGHEIVCRVAGVDEYFNSYSMINCDRNTESILVAELRSSGHFKMAQEALLASLTTFPLTKACSYTKPKRCFSQYSRDSSHHLD